MIVAELYQRIVPREFHIKSSWLKKVLRAIEKRLKLRGTHTLSIAFVDHATMRRLNRTYRNKDKVTDILSFITAPPLRERGGRGELRRNSCDLGELILAWPYVKNQAHDLGKSLNEEIAFLLVHGVLHLRGYDHEKKSDAARMFPLQEKIYADFLAVNH